MDSRNSNSTLLTAKSLKRNRSAQEDKQDVEENARATKRANLTNMESLPTQPQPFSPKKVVEPFISIAENIARFNPEYMKKRITRLPKMSSSIMRIVLGSELLDYQAREMPEVMQIKLLEDAKANTIYALNPGLALIVLDPSTRDKTIEHLQKSQIQALIAFTLKNNLATISATLKVFPEIFTVEIDGETTIEDMLKLAKVEEIHFVILGHDVKPEVTAAIPDRISHVGVGYGVTTEALQPIPQEKLCYPTNGKFMLQTAIEAEVMDIEKKNYTFNCF